MTTQNLEVVSTDADRGLILVHGAVPGAKGAWILVRDAVKVALPANAPKPAAIRAGCGQDRSSGHRGSRIMDLKITTLGGKDAGTLTLSDAIFGLEPRADILQRMVRWQLAKTQQGTHKTKGRAEIARTGAKMYKQKGTGRARHHRRALRSSAAAARPTARSCAATRTTCRRRCARSA